MECREVLVEFDWEADETASKFDHEGLRVKKSRGLYAAFPNSGETSNGEEKYWRVADEAMERTWCDEPAFPGMKRTGDPSS